MAVSAIDATGVNEFHRELIDRFFNPKSYFLFSFITELKKREALLEKPENVAAIGLVVDEIIGSENKFGKILDLTRIPGFDFFYHTLLEKVEYLRVAHLTTQQMMETVKSLGVNLAEAFDRIMADPEARDALLKYVGIEVETAPSSPPVEEAPRPESQQPIAEEAEAPAAGKEIDLSKLDNLFADEQPGPRAPDPWDFFYEDVNGKLNQIDALLDKFEASAHDRALLSEIKSNFQELREWAMIQGNEGIETIAMRLLIALNLALRTFSYPLNAIIPHVREAIKALREVNKFGWAGENLDIIPVVIRRLESLYTEIKQTAAGSEEAPAPAEQNSPESVPAAKTETEALPNEEPVPEPEQAVPPVAEFGEEETSVLEEEPEEPAEPAEFPVSAEEEISIQAEETEISFPELTSEKPPEDSEEPEAKSGDKEEFEEILLEPDFDLGDLQEEPSESVSANEAEESVARQEEPAAEPEEDLSEAELSETVSEMERLYQEMFPEEFEEEAEYTNPPQMESESRIPEPENLETTGEVDSILGEALDDSLLASEPEEPEPAAEPETDLQLPGEEDDDLRQIIEEISAEESFQPTESTAEEISAPAAAEEKEKAVPEPEPPVEKQKPVSEAPPELLQHGGRDFVEEADMYFQFTQKAFASLEKNPGLHRAFEDIELACYSLKILARKLGYIYVAKITEKIEEIFKSVLSGELLLTPEQIAYLSGIVVALKKRGLENRLSDEKVAGWAAEVLEKINQIKNAVPDVKKHAEPKKAEPETAEEDPLEFLMYEDTGKYFKQLLDD